MTSVDVVFERRDENVWQPVRFNELHAGDVARMRVAGGDVLHGEDGEEQFRVASLRGSDPDSRNRFDISLDPMK